MVINLHGVGKSQWKKWTKDGRRVFNDLYEYSVNNERLFNHPETILLADERWKTVAWNHAWMAADFISRSQFDK